MLASVGKLVSQCTGRHWEKTNLLTQMTPAQTLNRDSIGIPVENSGDPTPPHPKNKIAPYGNWGGVLTRQKCVEKPYATCWYPYRKILSREMAIRELFLIFGFSSSQNTSNMGLISFLFVPVLGNTSFYFRYLYFPTTRFTKKMTRCVPKNHRDWSG